MGNLFQ